MYYYCEVRFTKFSYRWLSAWVLLPSGAATDYSVLIRVPDVSLATMIAERYYQRPIYHFIQCMGFRVTSNPFGSSVQVPLCWKQLAGLKINPFTEALTHLTLLSLFNTLSTLHQTMLVPSLMNFA